MFTRIEEHAAIEHWCASMHLILLDQIKRSDARSLIACKINFIATLKPLVSVSELEVSLRELSFDIWACLTFVCSLIQIHDYVCIWHDELIEIFKYANNIR